MDEADDVVGRLPGHRIAGVRRLGQLAYGLVRRHVAGQEVHLGPRQHHLAQAAIAGGEDVVHDLPFLVTQRGRGPDHGPDLLVGDLLPAGLGVAAQQAHRDVGGHPEQPDHRPGDLCREVDEGPEHHGHALGPLQGQPFGGQLAQDDREVGDHDRDQDGGDGQRDRGGQPQELEVGREVPRERRRTEGSRQEARQRDPDLHRREEPVRVLSELGHRLAALAPMRQLADLALPQGDQRHLGSGEHAADDDEKQDQQDVEQHCAHEIKVVLGIGCRRCRSGASVVNPPGGGESPTFG